MFPLSEARTDLGPEPDLGLADVAAAAQRLAGQIVRTPCLESRTLGEILGCRVWLKFENLQYTASFKERGALNRLLAIPEEQRRRGVVAMSAGNHAQGVAYHARRLGIPVTIVMPRGTPFVKIENTERLGAEVLLAGETVDEAAAEAVALCARTGGTFVHPFDDPLVIAGQGTLALEMLEAVPDLEVLVVPVGGGGLISGIALAAKASRPDIEIVGVQATSYPGVAHALGLIGEFRGEPTIADGIAVKVPGRCTLEIIRRRVDAIALVDEAAIERAVVLLLEIEKTVSEGAGAVGIAALETFRDRFAARKVGVVLSGGNIDGRLLSSVILRGLVRSERMVRLRVALADSPGGLARATAAIAAAHGNIVDVVHQRAFSRGSARVADVDFTIEVRNGRHAQEIEAGLRRLGLEVERLS
ncbi:MAG: threonine ammonia-lyase [Geminicoccaceae bacterium]|nr:threonine ammonia-lyase [Geminicoccaceae bacterium]MDW8124876.1 threonine ammonia-lyase [Geminicoccaceae bacterium]